MPESYWQKQGSNPLFPDLLWSRPENRQFAGKLLIVGGNLHGFAAPAEAYQTALTAGVGVGRVLLPDALQKTVGRVFEAGEFAPSTPSGSFGQKALNELLSYSQWSDGVLLAGDLGRNSETAIMLEKFAAKFEGKLIITKDATDYFTSSPKEILSRPQTLFVITMAQLQKLAIHGGFEQSFTFSMDLLRLVEALHSFTERFEAGIVIKHLDTMCVSIGGQVSSTKLKTDLEDMWRVKIAAFASVWWLQNPGKPFEAITTAIHAMTV